MLERQAWTKRAPLIAVAMLVGCQAPTAAGRLAQAETVENGTMLNGVMLNGIMLNGVMLNGIMLNGVMLNGIMLNGIMLNGIMLNGPTLQTIFAAQLESVARDGATLAGTPLAPLAVAGGLSTTTPDGATLAGSDLIGAHLTGRMTSGLQVALRIDDATVDPEPGNDDITLYTVSVGVAGGWFPLCGLDENQRPAPAVAVAGRWNYGRGRGGGDHVDDPAVFTFGCVDAAIGKCERLGYKPWKHLSQCADGTCRDVDLAAYHQACTRMVRADYCGDGTSHTISGTWINVYDGEGIQRDDEPWYFEAEWAPGGARCVTHQRVVDLSIVPGCVQQVSDPTCGDLSHFGAGTLLMDEYEVQPTRR